MNYLRMCAGRRRRSKRIRKECRTWRERLTSIRIGPLWPLAMPCHDMWCDNFLRKKTKDFNQTTKPISIGFERNATLVLEADSLRRISYFQLEYIELGIGATECRSGGTSYELRTNINIRSQNNANSHDRVDAKCNERVQHPSNDNVWALGIYANAKFRVRIVYYAE